MRPLGREAEGDSERDPDEQAQADLLFTLEMCRKSLPEPTHPEHFENLRRIERIVKDYFEQDQRARITRHD
jgi:hypothetical protein